MVSDSERDKSNLIIPIAVVAVLLPLGIGAFWLVGGRRTEPAAPAPLTAEDRAYAQSLKLAKVELKATENYAGAAVVEVLGTITNAGNRAVSFVELNCVFADSIGEVVLRERVPIVKAALAPGETRNFRLPFEGIPRSWNQALPQLVIARIRFAA